MAPSWTIRETQCVHVAYQGPISQHLITSPRYPAWARVVMEGGRRQRDTQEGCISPGMAAEPVRRMWQCQKSGQARTQDAGCVSFFLISMTNARCNLFRKVSACSQVKDTVGHVGKAAAVRGRIVPTVRKQRESTPASACFLVFIQCGTTAHGMPLATFDVDLCSSMNLV